MNMTLAVTLLNGMCQTIPVNFLRVNYLGTCCYYPFVGPLRRAMRFFLDFRIRVHKGDSGSRWSKGVGHIVQWVIKWWGCRLSIVDDTIGRLRLITLPNYALQL